jgi:hypothetical protein
MERSILPTLKIICIGLGLIAILMVIDRVGGFGTSSRPSMSPGTSWLHGAGKGK